MVTEAMRGVGGSEPGAFGKRIMELAERLAQWSESSDGLTCTYLSPAHRAVAAEIRNWMRQAGLITEVDAVANVIGRYAAADPRARTLIMASHYDTVRNAGKYDGRLGILTALVLVEHLKRLGRKLPFHLDVSVSRRVFSAAARWRDGSTANCSNGKTPTATPWRRSCGKRASIRRGFLRLRAAARS